MPRRNNGSRLKWLDKRGKWYVVWTENGRSRERSTGTEDLEEAEIFHADFLRKSRTIDGPLEPRDVLITEILHDYVEHRHPLIRDGARLVDGTTPLVRFFEGANLHTVTPETCQRYRAWRERSDGTVRRELGILRAAINHAFRQGRISRAVPVDLPPPPAPRDRWITRAEADALYEAARSMPRAGRHLSLFIAIAMHTGQRKDAILGLRWHQVDLDKNLIQWNPEGRAQTKKRRKPAPIPPDLWPIIAKARLKGTAKGYVVNIDGKPVGDIKKSFARACEIAGLEDVSPHTLRHSRATWGMQKGAKPWELAGFLGMSLETLQKTYGHHHPDYQRDAASNY